MQSIPPHPTFWRSIVIFFHQRLGLSCCLFPSGLSTKILYAPVLSLVLLATCPAYLIILNFISRKIFQKECRSWSFSLRSLLHSPLTSSPLGPSVSLSTLFSNNLGLFCTVTYKCTSISQLSHSYMFRHYRVILKELVINTLPSYTGISNAAFGNTVYN